MAREIQTKALGICNQNLSPNGLAIVAYNVNPGWHIHGIIRDLLCCHVSQFQDPTERLTQARSLINFMKKNLSEENLYGKPISNELALLQSLPDGYLYHDHLEEHNNPVCFHQFVDAAATHGLQYVADAEFSKEIGQDLSEKARQDADKAQQEQYMDFLRNETFRKSILSYVSIPLQKSLDISAFERFFVALVEPLQSSELELTSPEPAAFDIRRVKIECSHPIVKASLSYLGKI